MPKYKKQTNKYQITSEKVASWQNIINKHGLSSRVGVYNKQTLREKYNKQTKKYHSEKVISCQNIIIKHGLTPRVDVYNKQKIQ